MNIHHIIMSDITNIFKFIKDNPNITENSHQLHLFSQYLNKLGIKKINTIDEYWECTLLYYVCLYSTACVLQKCLDFGANPYISNAPSYINDNLLSAIIINKNFKINENMLKKIIILLNFPESSKLLYKIRILQPNNSCFDVNIFKYINNIPEQQTYNIYLKNNDKKFSVACIDELKYRLNYYYKSEFDKDNIIQKQILNLLDKRQKCDMFIVLRRRIGYP